MNLRCFVILSVNVLLTAFASSNSHAMYEPGSGRFCSRDPIGYADGENTYAYVGNKPLVYRDPFGLEAVGDEGIMGTIFSLIPPNPCGSAWISVNATAVGPVVDDSWLATDATILSEANKEIAKRLPFNRSVNKSCPPGRKCCPLLSTTLNLNVLLRVKYKATNVPVIGNVTATLNVSVTSTSSLNVGVCIKKNCPCPPGLPPVVITQSIDRTGNVIDGNSVEDWLNSI